MYGAPGEIRTPDRLVRSQVLYPAELRARKKDVRLCGCAHKVSIMAFFSHIPRKWRRARDSNPRWALTHTPLAGARLQPLGQLSWSKIAIIRELDRGAILPEMAALENPFHHLQRFILGYNRNHERYPVENIQSLFPYRGL